MHKRSFLMGTAGAVLGAGAGAGAQAAIAPAPAAQAVAADALLRPALAGAAGLAQWSAYVGQAFELQSPGGPVAVVLSRLDRLADARHAPGHEQFVLGFSSPRALPSGLYSLVHPQAGACTLGLTADAAAGAAATTLRAEFNLLPASA